MIQHRVLNEVLKASLSSRSPPHPTPPLPPQALLQNPDDLSKKKKMGVSSILDYPRTQYGKGSILDNGLISRFGSSGPRCRLLFLGSVFPVQSPTTTCETLLNSRAL